MEADKYFRSVDGHRKEERLATIAEVRQRVEGHEVWRDHELSDLLDAVEKENG